MKLYKVIKNGIETNGWTSDSGKDETHYEPGFGKPERWVRASDGEDVSQAIETRFYMVEPAIGPVVDEQGNEVEAGKPAVMGLEYKLPAEFQIVIEDLSAKIEEQKARKEARRNRKAMLKQLKGKNLTAAETRNAVELILDEMFDDEKD